ncbi:MAG: ATP-dependent DNA helicase RecG [Bacillota bacterium]|nr:ATP-dependent DNA helicase RecG [Bacillota bacterium]
MDIYNDVGCIKGIGPKTKDTLNKCGIYSILDLLLYFPRDYEMVSYAKNSSEFAEGEKVIVKCIVKSIERDQRTKNNKVVSTIVFAAGDKLLYGKWFNQPFIKNKFKINNEYLIMGKIKYIKNYAVITSPVELKNNPVSQDNIIPKYSLKGSLTNKLMFNLISEALNQIKITENLPEWIVRKYKFCTLDEAIRNVHRPQNRDDLNKGLQRLKFQELFAYSMKILVLKDFINKNKHGIPFKIAPELKDFKDNLPFQLTNAQTRVVREILIDEKKPASMNRLVQGDVGSGKTIIALIAIFNIIKNGYQAAFMAPTEILANQHYEEAKKLLEKFDVKVKLLTGSVSAKNKERIKNEIKNGEIDLLIGTHAIIEDNVEFDNLGIVVTDEQHRFGVLQRNKLFNKGNNMDVLVMTATPIPRTLALFLYGDLDISIIDELPPGRQKIDTYYIDEDDKERVYNFAVSQINEGRQIYVVCPLVEENEELQLSSVETLYNEVKEQYFKDISVEMLHGKMSPKVKDEIMQRFKKGEVKVLVSTTVIEVGVNVPNASVMIIENAERFGLAQLHQLRGRVGRGEYKSYCILIAKIKSEITKKRMEIMQNSNDGFYIAEQDLRIRGTGEMFGYRQSGDNGLVLADLVEDINLLKDANIEAQRLINSENDDDIRIKNEIMKKLEESTKYICFN